MHLLLNIHALFISSFRIFLIDLSVLLDNLNHLVTWTILYELNKATRQMQYHTNTIWYSTIVQQNYHTLGLAMLQVIKCFSSLLQSMQFADSAISRHTGMKHTHLESGFGSRKWAKMHQRAFVLSWWPPRGPGSWANFGSRKTDGGLWRCSR